MGNLILLEFRHDVPLMKDIMAPTVVFEDGSVTGWGGISSHAAIWNKESMNARRYHYLIIQPIIAPFDQEFSTFSLRFCRYNVRPHRAKIINY